jgi:hypothetical protein
MGENHIKFKCENYQKSIPGFKQRKERPEVIGIQRHVNTKVISNEDKRKVFTDTFRIIKRLKDLEEDITLYFYLISLIEDRLNSLWSYNYWREVNNLQGDRPDVDLIQKYSYRNKITNLYDSYVFKELNFTKKLIQVFYERNTKVHQTIWSRDKFSKQDNETLEKIFRKLDKIKRDLLKQSPYSKYFQNKSKKKNKN